MAHEDVSYRGNNITDIKDFPYDWYSDESWSIPQVCVRYEKSEMLQRPEKIISEHPYRVIQFDAGVKEGKVIAGASMQWSSSSSVTNTTSLELGLKAMSKVFEASATFKSETSITRTLGRDQTATFQTECLVDPKHVVEVFIDKWKVKTRFHTTTWQRAGAGALHFVGLRNPWHGRGFLNFSGDKGIEDCEYTLDSWPRFVAFPIGDPEGFEEMVEKQRSVAFKFNWVRFANNVIKNHLDEDEAAKLNHEQVEKAMRPYYEQTKPKSECTWPEYFNNLKTLL